MSSKQRILDQIRTQLRRGPLDARTTADLEKRTLDRHRNLIPQRGLLQGAARLEMFLKMAAHVKAEARVIKQNEVAQHLKPLLGERRVLHVSKAVAEMGLPLADAHLTLSRDIPRQDGALACTTAYGAVAESATLVMKCDAGHPHTLNILAHTHVVLLPLSRLWANYEESWATLRKEDGGKLPRALLWVTGPSRTGDIEQTMQLGAHGPKSLHIFVLEDV